MNKKVISVAIKLSAALSAWKCKEFLKNAVFWDVMPCGLQETY
jgi:hypothetical protein